MAIRVNGLISGLDTDAIVKELVSAYSTRKDKYTKAQTKLEWKMDAWKSMNSKIYGFYSSSLSAMRLSSAYNIKTANISRDNVAKVTAGAGAANGTHKLKVKSLASSAYMTGGVVSNTSGGKVTGDMALSELGIESGSKISLGGNQIEITDGMNVNQLVAKFKEAGVNANFDATNQRFFINATKSGEEGEFTLMADNAKGLSALQKLGLFALKDVNGEDTAEMKKYQELAASGEDNEKVRTARAVVAAATNTLSVDPNAETLVATYEANARTVAAYTAKRDLVNAFNDKEAYFNAEQANMESYRLGFRKGTETVTDDQGNTVTQDVMYTDAEIAEMKRFIEENRDSTDTAVMQEMADKQNIIDAKEKYEAVKAAQDYINDTANIAAKDEAVQYVADNQTAYDDANAYITAAGRTEEYQTVKMALNASNAVAGRSDAARIAGKDSEIVLNGATFKSSTGTYSVNGLSITATEVTGDEEVTINVATDTKGIYDKIKDFLGKYNELIKEMDKAYNAASAGSYEPLTDEEKEAMTDKQIEKWEEKIKDALLRRDSTLGGVSSSMKSIMQMNFTIGGKTYSLSSFGISTAGYFASDASERGTLHIDGDADDSLTSGKTDKLMEAINSNPEAVTEFFQKLSGELYDKLTKKMSSSTVSSAYTIYNDKQMSSEYSDYKKKINSWDDKLKYYEDYYYKKFSAMEKALSQLQSTTNSLGNLFGTNK